MATKRANQKRGDRKYALTLSHFRTAKYSSDFSPYEKWLFSKGLI